MGSCGPIVYYIRTRLEYHYSGIAATAPYFDHPATSHTRVTARKDAKQTPYIYFPVLPPSSSLFLPTSSLSSVPRTNYRVPRSLFHTCCTSPFLRSPFGCPVLLAHLSATQALRCLYFRCAPAACISVSVLPSVGSLTSTNQG